MKSTWLVSFLVFSALVLLIQGKVVLFKRTPTSIHDSISHLHRHDVLHNAHHITPKTPINVARHVSGPTPTGNELVAIRDYLTLFGIENPKAELSLHRVYDDAHFADSTVRHYHQYYHGIRVDAGDIRLFVNNEKEITHVFGTFIPNLKVDTTVLVKAKQAKNIAKKNRSTKWGGIPSVIDSIELVIHVSGLPSGRRASDNLAWKVVVSNSHHRATLYVDAHNGEIIDIYERHYDALNRVVRKGTPNGQVIFTEGDPLPTGEPEALSILSASALIYNNFKNAINRLSYDGNDAQMKIVVELFDASGTTCPNAFWDSTQIQFCTGLATTDVTVHEWGHAYTEFTHNLVYAAQSGALNEAYSDILAEAIQIMNNAPVAFNPTRTADFACLTFAATPEAGRRWIVGDEVDPSVFGTDGLRDMWNPNCLKQPRSVSDPTFDCSFTSQTCDESNDQCGVHGNSGVPNQAFALAVDGGTLNGVTVVGIGAIKAFHIYVRAMVSLQTSTTTFNQHATALATACSQLTGAAIANPADGSASTPITAADCTSVANAMAATQMSAAVCSAPAPPSTSNKVLFVEPRFAPTASNVATTFFVDVSGKVATNPTCVFRTGPTPATAPSTGVRTNEATGVIIVTCDIPASLTGLGVYDVFIGDSNGNVDAASTSSAKITVVDRPTLTSISPKNGPTTATTLVTITGSGFQNLDATGCYSVPLEDVNGDKVDCLSTIPGNFDLNFPVKVTYENPTTVTFKMPVRSSVLGTEECFLVPFSLNTQIYMFDDTIGFSYGSTPFTSVDNCNNPSSSSSVSSSVAPSTSASDEEVCIDCGPTCVLRSFRKRCTKKLGGFVTRNDDEICCNFSGGIPSSFSFKWVGRSCDNDDKQEKLQLFCEGLGGSATCTNPGLWRCSS